MKLIPLVLSLVLFQACAAKKLAVDHADTFIESAVEKRLPLYSEQKTVLSKDIDRFLEKNKESAQELMPIIDQINLEKPEHFDEIYDKVLAIYKKVSSHFSQIMAKHLATLDSNQQKKFFRTVKAENMDMSQKDSATRMDQIQQKVEKLIGPLSDNQEKFFVDYQSYFSEKAKARIERREKLHEKLKEILAQDSSTKTKEEQILETFHAFQLESMESSRGNLPIIQKFVPSLTAKQKESFRNRMRDLREMVGYYLEADY